MISIKNLAKKLNMTRPALNHRMKKIKGFKNKYTVMKHEQLFISDVGAKKISYEKHNSTSKSIRTRQGSSNHQITKADMMKWVNQLVATNRSQQRTISQLSAQLSKRNQKALREKKSSIWERLRLAFHHR